MKSEHIYKSRSFSPWVFVTYGCSCKCEYCMIPDMKCGPKSMSAETFRKMMETTEKLLDEGTYDNAFFRLSGGEPFLVFENYKDIVTEYKKKYPRQFGFGILTNFVRFNDEIADWMEENNIGMQVSLDDLVDGKPLNDGTSSSWKVLENIQKLQTRDIPFSMNTVLDVAKTKSLVGMANFVSSFRNLEWGLNASYTEKDGGKVDEVIAIFDECIFQLVKRGFDVRNSLRFYNTIVGQGRGGCSAGVESFAIGTGLEVWPCQSLCDGKPIGVFDEKIKKTLAKAKGNEYFRSRKMRQECSDCSVLGYCRGGCRATHESDETNDVVCRIRRDIIGKLASGYYTQGYNNHQCHYGRNFNCGVDHDHGAQIQKMLEDYIHENPNMKTVETPEIS